MICFLLFKLYIFKVPKTIMTNFLEVGTIYKNAIEAYWGYTYSESFLILKFLS